MADTPQIFGQQLPPANIDTNLLTVSANDQAMVNIYYMWTVCHWI